MLEGVRVARIGVAPFPGSSRSPAPAASISFLQSVQPTWRTGITQGCLLLSLSFGPESHLRGSNQAPLFRIKSQQWEAGEVVQTVLSTHNYL